MTTKKFVAKNGLDNNGQTITNVANPVNDQDVATKNYVAITPASSVVGVYSQSFAAADQDITTAVAFSTANFSGSAYAPAVKIRATNPAITKTASFGLLSYNDNTQDAVIHLTDATTSHMFIFGSTGAVTLPGNLIINGTLTETSTRAVKENIRNITNGTDVITRLQGVIYDLKDGTATNQAGLIAEDVDGVAPELTSKDTNGELVGVQYGRTVAYLIEAVKEQNTRIAYLEELLGINNV